MDHKLHFGEYDGSGTVTQKSVGYLVRDDEDIIAIAQTMTEGKASDVLVIDKRMHVKTKFVRKAEK